MKKANITIAYDEEMLNAIRLFLTQKDLDLDKELTGFLDQLFKRHVPSSVRDYLELRDCVAPSPPQKKPSTPGTVSAPKS